jgi:hypothetical protein
MASMPTKPMWVIYKIDEEREIIMNVSCYRILRPEEFPNRESRRLTKKAMGGQSMVK